MPLVAPISPLESAKDALEAELRERKRLGSGPQNLSPPTGPHSYAYGPVGGAYDDDGGPRLVPAWRVTVDLCTEELVTASGKPAIRTGRTPRGTSETLLDILQAGLLQEGETLFLRSRGVLHQVVLEAGGTLRNAEGHVFNSPSAASQAARQVKADDGWLSWWVIRDEAEVILADLRNEYRLRLPAE